MWLTVRSVFFALLIPGAVAGWIPVWIGGGFGSIGSFGALQWMAMPALAVGLAILARTIYEFAVSGRGTLAPVDPPTKLVIRGLYRHVRNPMYVGVLATNLGWALLFQSLDVLIYAIAVWLIQFAIVVLYEEPHLHSVFGAEYGGYCRSVGRWLPNL